MHQTIHNGADPAGKRVFLTLLQNRTCLLIRPVEDTEDNAPSIKFPVKTILRLEIGKTKSSVLARSIYDHIPSMTCFSIVVKLWSEAETYFDFEASSVIEREALISTLMVVLDQIHNTSMISSSVKNGTASSLLQANKDAGNKSNDSSGTIISPGKRTKIHSSPYFVDNREIEGGDQEGMEMSLANKSKLTMDGSDTPNSTSNRLNTTSKPKPLRQRQMQPEARDGDNNTERQGLVSPILTSNLRQSPFFQTATKPTTPLSNSKITIKSAPKSPYNANSPLEVVVVKGGDTNHNIGDDEQRDGPPQEEGGVVIMDSHHPHSAKDEIELGLEGEDNYNFKFPSHKGLPVSKIHFNPTREFAESNNNSCNNKDGRENGNNQQAAWCTDDICTLALKDIAETCTGMFNHPDSLPTVKDGVKTHLYTKEDLENIACRPGCAAEERVIVEEYIAGVLGGPAGIFANGGDAWNVENSKQAPTKDKSKRNHIKNRASHLNAQAMRLRSLRNEMTFAAALKRSKEKMHFVQTTKSFDDIDSERLRQAQDKSFSRMHSSALMGSMINGMVATRHNLGDDDDAVYYDSDPEDARPRTRGVRRASANRRNAITEQDEKPKVRPPVLSGVGFEKIAIGKKLRKLDEELIIDIVQVRQFCTCLFFFHNYALYTLFYSCNSFFLLII